MNLKLYVESNFDGLSKEDLRKLCKSADITPPPNAKEDWMKNAIRSVVNGTSLPEPEKEAAPVAKLDAMPNLTPNGYWGGRRHLVIVQPSNDVEAKTKGTSVRWEGVDQPLPWGVQLSIGEPWYNVMKQQKRTISNIKTQTDEDGTKRVALIDNQVPVVQFQYLGVDPATAHLPGSMLEYYQALAKDRDFFSKSPRRALVRILSDVKPEIGSERQRQMSDEDLRYEILDFLGPEYVEHVEVAA